MNVLNPEVGFFHLLPFRLLQGLESPNFSSRVLNSAKIADLTFKFLNLSRDTFKVKVNIITTVLCGQNVWTLSNFLVVYLCIWTVDGKAAVNK